jgi:hypothetical protein
MKKESTYDVNKEYDLAKYKKDEFTQLIFKEFAKYGKKLGKIAGFEEMRRQKKPLLPEMEELLTKKDQFKNHLDSLKIALDLYVKGISMPVQQPKAPQPQPSVTDTKMELREALNKLCATSATRLGNFFALAKTLSIKESAVSSLNLTPAQKDALTKIFKGITLIEEDDNISLADEAKKSNLLLHKILTESTDLAIAEEGKKITFAELTSLVDKILEVPSMPHSIKPVAQPIAPAVPVRQEEPIAPKPKEIVQPKESQEKVKVPQAEPEAEEEQKEPATNEPYVPLIIEEKKKEPDFSYVPTEEEEKAQREYEKRPRGRGRGRGQGYGRRRGGDQNRGRRYRGGRGSQE